MAIITVSRGTFVGGQALAECLAERLGYRCLSREEVLQAATAEYGVPVEKLVAAMDKPPSFWERLIGERTVYLNYVRAALCERVRGGDVVFHGYVGHLLLGSISHVIRVRVIAETESRIEAAMRAHNLSRKDAIARINKIDQDRARWTRFLYGVDWQDAALYDAVLNLTRLGVDGACDIVASMTRMEAFQPTAASLKAMEDLALGSRVWAALATDPHTEAPDLTVSADGGVVSITGSVWSSEVADAVPLVARRVEGVRDVRAELTIAPLYTEPI